ncbi:lipopolysaccharide transport system permease protein [Rhodopseudomonas thermotolerans]|uniref:Transport permease protein n=3 Tax=Nitrobacteraceae TaxID=41294 RepID=A0A336JNN0_9BRAD|nr:lipopolysaccharide transport system permease protein [Rhodopseudomonas pentothenatexigens]REG05174.1 lipopolysaccharide transport system permease protein [Rhodopseudomonas thermotolerans]SSW90006.1 lipopolysaccharide transport system permease protein [Rhodopseudomonas pentothenatexigens]
MAFMTANSNRQDDDGGMQSAGGTILIRPHSGLTRLGIPQVFEYSYLLKFFVLRNLRARYRPTLLGYGWIVLRPALLCLVYALVFGHLLGVQSPGVPMVLFVFFGVVVYLFFASALTEVANSLSGAAGIMSKVYYPRLITPLSALTTNLVDLASSMLIIFAMMAFYGVIPPIHVFYFPLFLAGFVLVTFGFGLILASYSVERRDIMIALPVAMRVLIYAMPAVYPISLVSERHQVFYYLNPLAVYLQGMRWSLMNDQAVPLWSIALAVVVTVASVLYGLVLFNRVERTMVDRL